MSDCPITIVLETPPEIVIEVTETPIVVVETPFIPVFPSGSAKPLHTIQFALPVPIPGAALAYLFNEGVSTLGAPWVANRAVAMRDASVSLSAPDPAETWDIEFLVNAAVVQILSIPAGTSKVSTVAFSAPLAVQDELRVRIARTSGSGPSPFRRALVHLGLQET